MRRLKESAQAQVGARAGSTSDRPEGARTSVADAAQAPSAETAQRDWVLQATRSALLEFDAQMRITAAYGAVHQLAGHAPQHLLGRKVQEILPGSCAADLPLRNGKSLVVNDRPVRVHVQPPDASARPQAGRLCLTPLDTDRGAAAPREPGPGGGSLDKIVGCSAALHHLKDLAVRIAGSDLPVLLTGESGTGKELFARAIHEHSQRRHAPFVAINCAAVPESLLEAELFGYEPGAFTGADRKGRIGLFEQARGGTLLLDEVGDMPLARQAAFLRALEEGCSRRVGGLKPIPIDVRIIAATNRPLEELVEQGAFRLDLFHRLCALPMRLTPLRERVEDISTLVSHFMESMGRPGNVPPDVMDCLLGYSWPGNVRELRHCIEYMCTVNLGGLTRNDLPPSMHCFVGALDEPHGRAADVEGEHEALDAFILEAIAQANAAGYGLGRLALAARARSRGIHTTENKVRARMHALRERGLLLWHRGRGGARLTLDGQRRLGRASR